MHVRPVHAATALVVDAAAFVGRAIHVGRASRHVVAHARRVGGGAARVLQRERVRDHVAGVHLGLRAHVAFLDQRKRRVVGVHRVHRDVGRAVRVVAARETVGEQRLVFNVGLRVFAHAHLEGDGLARLLGHHDIGPVHAVARRVVGAAVAGRILHVGGAGRDVVARPGVFGVRAAVVPKRQRVGDHTARVHGRAGRRIRALLQLEYGGHRHIRIRAVDDGVAVALRILARLARLARIFVVDVVERDVFDEGGRVVVDLDRVGHLLGLVGRNVGQYPLHVGAPVSRLLVDAAVGHRHVGGARRDVVAHTHVVHGVGVGVLGLQRIGNLAALGRVAARLRVGRLVDRHLAGVGRVALAALRMFDDVRAVARVRAALPAVGKQCLIGHDAAVAQDVPSVRDDLHGKRHRGRPLRGHTHARPLDAVGGRVVDAAARRRALHVGGALRDVVARTGLLGLQPAVVLEHERVDNLRARADRGPGRRVALLFHVDEGGHRLGVVGGLLRLVGLLLRVVTGLAGLSRVLFRRVVKRRVLDVGLGVLVHRYGVAHGLLTVGRDVFQHPLDIAVRRDEDPAVRDARKRGARRHVVAYARVGHLLRAGVFRSEGVGDGAALLHIVARRRVRALVDRQLVPRLVVGRVAHRVHHNVRGVARVGVVLVPAARLVEQGVVAHFARRVVVHTHLELHGRGAAVGVEVDAVPFDTTLLGVVAAAVGLAAALDIGGAGRDVVHGARVVGGLVARIGEDERVLDLLAGRHFLARGRVRLLLDGKQRTHRIVLVGRVLGGHSRRLRVVRIVAGVARVVVGHVVERDVFNLGLLGRLGVHRHGELHGLRVFLAHGQVFHDPLDVVAVLDIGTHAVAVHHALERGVGRHVVAYAHVGRRRVAGVHRRQGVGDVGAGLHVPASRVGRLAHRHLGGRDDGIGWLNRVLDLVGRALGVLARARIPVDLELGLVFHGAGGIVVDRHGERERLGLARRERNARPLQAADLLVVGERALLRRAARLVGGAGRNRVGHARVVRGLLADVGHLQRVGNLRATLHQQAGFGVGALRHLKPGVRGRVVGLVYGRSTRVFRILRVVARLAGVVLARLRQHGVRDVDALHYVFVHRHGKRDGLGVVFADAEILHDPLDVAARRDIGPVAGIHALERRVRGHVVADAHERRGAGPSVHRLQGVGDVLAALDHAVVGGFGRLVGRHRVARGKRRRRGLQQVRDRVGVVHGFAAGGRVPPNLVARLVGHGAGSVIVDRHGEA